MSTGVMTAVTRERMRREALNGVMTIVKLGALAS
jgi:hypothetical protein